eukprot:6522500-Lingulodinium_polyedra.AAC.1
MPPPGPVGWHHIDSLSTVKYRFLCNFANCISAEEFLDVEAGDVWVLPKVSFLGGRMVVSHVHPEPLQ